MNAAPVWVGIALCLSQSAAFSGLNLALFSMSRLWLEAAAETGDDRARRVLALRQDANVTLATILIGNVAVNVLLTLLADSMLAGAAAFVFSTVVITALGEIAPQAYLSRRALDMTSRLVPLLLAYRFVLWPIVKPIGFVLDRWVGKEGVLWFREAALRDVLRSHAREESSDVSELEATGAINFLALDDVPSGIEGELLNPTSIVAMPFEQGQPVFPRYAPTAQDPFLRQLNASGEKWVVITDPGGDPQLVLDADAFLRDALFGRTRSDPIAWCHRPVVVTRPSVTLGEVLGRLTVDPEHSDDDVIDKDLILVWTPSMRRVITGADILGRLMRGISTRGPARQPRDHARVPPRSTR